MAQIEFSGNTANAKRGTYQNGDEFLTFSVGESVRALNRQTNQWETVHTNWFKVFVSGWQKDLLLREGIENKSLNVFVKGTAKIGGGRDYTDKNGVVHSGNDQISISAKDVWLRPKANGGGNTNNRAQDTPSHGTSVKASPQPDQWSYPPEEEPPF